MVWKEVFAEPRLRLNWFGRIILILLIAASFLPPIIIIEYYHSDGGLQSGSLYRPFADSMNLWVRIVGTFVACLTLLAVGVRASSSISGERDRQTWDSLLATPLSSDAILFGKWLGSVASVRWAWLWLGSIWALGLVTGGLHPFAVPALVIAWLVYAVVGAGVGLWHSMHRRTSLRAALWTIQTCLMIGVGHWLVVGMGCYAPLTFLGMHELGLLFLLKVQFSQTPPAVLGWLAFDIYDSGADESMEITAFALLGVVSWAVGILFFWMIASNRFEQLTNRADRLHPRARSQQRRQSSHKAQSSNAFPAESTPESGL
jgi:ABC-type Na+ efflux pump permease subunit